MLDIFILPFPRSAFIILGLFLFQINLMIFRSIFMKHATGNLTALDISIILGSIVTLMMLTLPGYE